MRGIGILFTGMRSLLESDTDVGSVCHEPVTAAIVVLLFALVVVLVVVPVFATAFFGMVVKIQVGAAGAAAAGKLAVSKGGVRGCCCVCVLGGFVMVWL
jgi:hypothetical protein